MSTKTKARKAAARKERLRKEKHNQRTYSARLRQAEREVEAMERSYAHLKVSDPVLYEALFGDKTMADVDAADARREAERHGYSQPNTNPLTVHPGIAA